MANWSLPTLTSTYTNFLSELQARDTDVALQFSGTSSTNIPTGAIQWDSAANRWKKWNGTVWAELATTYALTNVSTTGTLAVGTTSTFTGNATFSGTSPIISAKAGPNSTQQHSFPAVTSDTFALLGATQTLTGKTLTSPTINSGAYSGTFSGNYTASGQVTFSNGTAPIITARLGPSSTQQHIVPVVASDTFALIGATQTLTGKTLTSPTINTATIAGGTINNAPIGGTTAAAGAFTTLSASGQLTLSSTGAAVMNVGTTAQRPTPATGMFRFNSTLGKFEGYTGAAWGSVGGGATGGGADEVFVENSQTVTTNYTLSAGKSAMSAGPVAINSGISVTVPSGSRWVIV
jgi:hypothetical protein